MGKRRYASSRRVRSSISRSRRGCPDSGAIGAQRYGRFHLLLRSEHGCISTLGRAWPYRSITVPSAGRIVVNCPGRRIPTFPKDTSASAAGDGATSPRIGSRFIPSKSYGTCRWMATTTAAPCESASLGHLPEKADFCGSHETPMTPRSSAVNLEPCRERLSLTNVCRQRRGFSQGT